eukprot:4532931-Pleurochrysis_carterae.AAC.1
MNSNPPGHVMPRSAREGSGAAHGAVTPSDESHGHRKAVGKSRFAHLRARARATPCKRIFACEYVRLHLRLRGDEGRTRDAALPSTGSLRCFPSDSVARVGSSAISLVDPSAILLLQSFLCDRSPAMSSLATAASVRDFSRRRPLGLSLELDPEQPVDRVGLLGSHALRYPAEAAKRHRPRRGGACVRRPSL